MSQDIVERLRTAGVDGDITYCWDRCHEAADEITKLRQQAEQLQGRLAVYDKNLRGRRTDTPDYCIALIKERDILRQQRDELVVALEKLARLGNGDQYGNSDGNMIAIAALAKIEGEK